MRIPLVILALSALSSLPVHAQVISRDPQTVQAMEDARRQQALIQQQVAQDRVQHAREKCLANRGADCDTMDGLSEWLLLDRTRAEAVLDRVQPLPIGGSASTGSSSVPLR